MPNNILFIFEGEKTEDAIAHVLKTHILKEDVIITCAFTSDIYSLYRVLKEDDDIDTFALLKEKPTNKTRLETYHRDDFAEIYLFFDYDGHATLAKDEKIEGVVVNGDTKLKELLELFDNETEKGKLYVSYPMVEAFRHIENFDTFNDLCVKCKGRNCINRNSCGIVEKCAKEPHYKTIVGTRSIPQLQNMNKYDDNLVKKLVKAHIQKMNYIVNDSDEFPIAIINQTSIFDAQLGKYISLECPLVAVLSAFPAFILDYYGSAKTRKILE